MKHKLSGLLLVSLLFGSSFVLGQKVTGTITGTVLDPQGAMVTGATVTIIDQATNASRSTTTNSAGTYAFPEVDPGMYTVKVVSSGFRNFIAKDVELHVSSVARLDAKLSIGTPTELVEVQAQAIQLNTENGEVGNVIDGNQVRELPLDGRNFVQLTTLMPGASVQEGFDSKSKGLMGGVDISFSGAPANANQWRVDGGNNNDIGSQRTILIYPSIDGIEEFKILRNSYGPEYGGAGGAQVNIVTKGGGNVFHGDAFYFGRNDVLNAKNYFIGLQQCANPNDPACRKQLLRRNDFGYTIGGPLKRDRVFFFWSEEWNYERRGAVRHDWVPSAQERLGNFSDLANCPSSSNAPALPNFPAGTTSAPGVLTPANVSPAGQAYAAQAPLPTTSVCNQFDWIAQVKVPLNWREENIRGDIRISPKNSLMVKYVQDAWDNPLHGSANGEAGLWGTQDFPGLSDAWTQPSKMAVGRLTTTITNTAINDFQFSWSDSNIGIARGGDDPSIADKIHAVMPTIFPTSGKLHSDQLPTPVCWCSTFFGIQSPWANRQDLYTWRDDFSKVAGAHTFKVGMLYDRNAKDEEQGSEAGAMWGAGGYKTVNWANTNNFYGDMLLKGMEWGGQENARNVIADIRWRDVEWYAGDTWKVRHNLTLDYGFRWSLIRPEYMDKNDYSTFDPAHYNPALKGDPCNGIVLPPGGDPSTCKAIGSTITPPFSPYRALRPSNNHLIAPRLGFAWDVFGTSKFVLRSGIGQFFSRDPVGLTLRTKANDPPYGVSAQGYRTLDGPLVPGVSVFDPGGAANPFAPGGTPSQSFEQNANLANSWQWNVTAETMLAKDTKLELGWVALRGIHLSSSSDINQVRPQDRLSYILRGLANSGDTRADLFPFGALTTSRLTQWNHRGDSIYHSLQAMFSTKMGRNSIIQSSYTWSHNIATSTLDYIDTTTGLSDTYVSANNRGNANYDRRHVFNVSVVYSLPALTGENAFVRGAAGGWEVGSIFNFAAGPALTASQGTVSNICPSQAQLAACNLPASDPNHVATVSINNPGGISPVNNPYGGRPLLKSSTPCKLGHSAQWVDPAAFTFNGYQLGGFSNTGQGVCPGPGTQDIDLSFNKSFPLPFKGTHIFTEGTRLQFRLEAFNLLNHPMFRFGSPQSSMTYAATGTLANGSVVGYLGPNNTIQGTVLTPNSSFGQPPKLNNIGNREIQYALKFIF